MRGLGDEGELCCLLWVGIGEGAKGHLLSRNTLYLEADTQPQYTQLNMDEEGVQALSLQKTEIGTSKVGFLLIRAKVYGYAFFLPSC